MKFCVDLQLLLHSMYVRVMLDINVRVKVSHKQKLHKVTGYKYMLKWPVQVG